MPAQKLFSSFRGIAIHTTDDLSTLINQEYTSDWVLNREKADKQKKLMVMSRIDRGHFFLANIIGVKETKSKGKRKRFVIYFDRGNKRGKNKPDLKFNQNPVKYY